MFQRHARCEMWDAVHCVYVCIIYIHKMLLIYAFIPNYYPSIHATLMIMWFRSSIFDLWAKPQRVEKKRCNKITWSKWNNWKGGDCGFRRNIGNIGNGSIAFVFDLCAHNLEFIFLLFFSLICVCFSSSSLHFHFRERFCRLSTIFWAIFYF